MPQDTTVGLPDLLADAMRTIADAGKGKFSLDFSNGVILRSEPDGKFIAGGYKNCAEEIARRGGE